MKQYYQSKDLVFKTRWMTDEGIYFSEKELEEGVLDEYLNNPVSLEEDIIFIPFVQIIKATPVFENEPPLLDVELLDPETYTPVVADFENRLQLQEVMKQIELHAGLKEKVEVIKSKAWIRNLFYTIASAFFGYSLVMVAQEIAAGKVIDVSGRRSGMKQVLARIAEQLGVLGSMLLAFVLVSGFAYFTYTIYKSSQTKRTVWER